MMEVQNHLYVTGQLILSAMVKSVEARFTDNSVNPPQAPSISKEQITEFGKYDSFFVSTLDVEQTKDLDVHYNRTYQMTVRFHPREGSKAPVARCNNVAEGLFYCLNRIQVPTFMGRVDEEGIQQMDLLPVVGRQMDFKVTDGVLQFFVTYKIRLREILPDIPTMQILDINEYVTTEQGTTIVE